MDRLLKSKFGKQGPKIKIPSDLPELCTQANWKVLNTNLKLILYLNTKFKQIGAKIKISLIYLKACVLVSLKVFPV